ncbi:COPII coat assembly protein sec16-like [Hibiscus syriacus]|uniref:COPII coat assembly protein sec16-like n=1 Tax=Hibiscus syriacus TaxID=106335 RepID=A0A6A3BPF2_HIBSY|nr:zinc finger CCCH domain-containing protein 41-like [Hibiscus syriacus]XP_039067011.1 zinc finger CCCH domain-containing protein 41-like [Hibiscus syriacus]KAE8718215.1 COPII coat assembly protein sec16-like [Hibiscus syriacus]
MKLKVSSSELGGISPPGCISEPEEKEVSDEEDDDRNHKHRRRDTCSQPLERDSTDPLFTRPYRKRNKPFENGHNESQAGETWKNSNSLPPEKDLRPKFDRRFIGLASLPRGHSDLNHRIRPNQTFSGDSDPGHGRGRDNSSWNQRDSRFNAVDIAYQMVQPGSVAPGLFAGRGLPNLSNAQAPSWSAFGLMPGIPNGDLDTLHSIGLQGVLRPPMNSSLNMGIPRQCCRDFEELGFCLRGDMCPMEHGVNRIVVEDFQSLSQFNLPVTVPSAQILAKPAGPGPPPSSLPPTTSMNSKGIHGKNKKSGITEDAVGLNGAYSGSTNANGDLYDPDQPLWNNNGPEASAALTGLRSPKTNETEPLPNDDISDCPHGCLRNGADNELPIRSTGSQSMNLSVWGRGRVGSSRSGIDTKDKIGPIPSDHPENETKEEQGAFPSSQDISCQVKRIKSEDDGSKVVDSSLKSQIDFRSSRKPTQKALHTLFVNGIPQKCNKREALLSHFRKFGEVIDIYIPLNGERAFVQFSRREEAEAALKAPDAVMGNRFIKLWWANRDNIPVDGIKSVSGVSVTPHGLTASAIPAQPVANRGNDNLLPVAQKSNVVHGADFPSLNSPKPVSMNGSQAPPPLQKKLDTLEQMKEQLRKKQEMLEQKRNDFRRKLDKLEKQSSVVKGDLLTEPAAKKQKVGIAADPAKALIPGSSESGAPAAKPYFIGMTDKNKSTENGASQSSKPSTSMALLESTSSKQQSRKPHLSAPIRHPFPMNKYKLDNRPIAFRVIPPLPSGFADVAVLKEHFLQYGDLSSVELQDMENKDAGNIRSEPLKNCSALITYRTRQSAERAYINGKCWQCHNLQFKWLTSNTNHRSNETPSSTPKEPLEAVGQTEEKSACNVAQEVTAASGNGEFGDLDRESFVEHMESAEASEQSLSPTSSMKESPKGDTS